MKKEEFPIDCNHKAAQLAVHHLNKSNWEKVNRLHMSRAISEFSHERILVPIVFSEESEEKHYKISPRGNQSIKYLFSAKILPLEHWWINPNSIKKFECEEECDLDMLLFILEFKDELGIDNNQLPGYMEEILNTLYGAAYILSENKFSSEELIHMDYQTIESSMTGHPCFIANNGRLGFSTDDYRRYAPETECSTELIWLAGHNSKASYSSIEELSYSELLMDELGENTINRFNAVLDGKKLNPNEYYFIPVHPWQWYNKLAMVFASDIAKNHLVFLGYGSDQYRPQQSVRTFYNVTNPGKFYVKTALSVLNMGFVRGLTPYYMDSTPVVVRWIKETIGKDSYIKKQGFELLFEVATVGYRNLYFESFGRQSHYNKMLSALWRESPKNILQEGQKLMTMASLLHVDQEGKSLFIELIKASNKSVLEWIKQYLKCYLKPLLHCFYQYDLVFMPHGENLIFIMKDHFPVKLVMKDISEEIRVFKDDNSSIPEKARRVCSKISDDLRTLSIFTDIFDCFFRFINQILVRDGNYPADMFWRTVADCVTEYQQENAHLRNKFRKYNLFVKEFDLCCLNRIQLKNHKQMLDVSNPVVGWQLGGKLKNPIAKYGR